MTNIFTQEFWREIEEETRASRKCLERMQEDLFTYKPHEKSMEMGYLAVLVAEIPKWVAITIQKGEIDFATWEHYSLTTTKDLLAYFEKNLELAKNALESVDDEKLQSEMFYLKTNGTELIKSSKKDSISSQIRHWVHHRGQLTVYMRLNDIPVPSLYGPSADDKNYR